MNFFDFLTADSEGRSLMHRMMAALGVDRQLKELPGHAAVEARAAERCSQCDHQGECMNWLDVSEKPDQPPEFCSNRDLIARLQKLTPAP